jgi:hypothetical protein
MTKQAKQAVIRIIIAIGLLVGAYTETGIFTTIIFAILLGSSEAMIFMLTGYGASDD